MPIVNNSKVIPNLEDSNKKSDKLVENNNTFKSILKLKSQNAPIRKPNLISLNLKKLDSNDFKSDQNSKDPSSSKKSHTATFKKNKKFRRGECSIQL